MDPTDLTDLTGRARGGDDAAFGALTEPYRQELLVHCYRMLGSLHDAEDALQDTLLAAWQGLAGFEGRSSLRTWLYRIATNRCLNTLRSARRRPAREWDMPGVEPPSPSRLGEVTWLEPFPDALLDPAARHEQTESISLAFVTALQLLPPRQLAVVVLRDVLGFRAREVAEMLDTTVDSVTSALKRGRAGLPRRGAPRRAPAPGSPAERELVARFVRAYESGDLDALLALFTDDIAVTMPPIPLEYHGLAAAARLFARTFGAGRRSTLTPTRANGHPAFTATLHSPSGPTPNGLIVLTLTESHITTFTRFPPDTLPHR